MTMFMGQLTDPFTGKPGDAAASTPVGAFSNAAGGVATSRPFGTAAGADFRFLAYKLAGFALAGGGANFSVVNGGTDDSRLFVPPAATPAEGSYATCGELHKRFSIFMLKQACAAHDHALEEANQPAEQGSNSMDDVQNLAQVKAELTYLVRLEQRHETNVASLKRLKEACDALRGMGSDVTGTPVSQKF